MQSVTSVFVIVAVALTLTLQGHSSLVRNKRCAPQEELFAVFSASLQTNGRPSCSSHRFQAPASGSVCFTWIPGAEKRMRLIDVSECTQVTLHTISDCRGRRETFVNPSRDIELNPFQSLNILRISGCQTSFEKDTMDNELLAGSDSSNELKGSLSEGSNEKYNLIQRLLYNKHYKVNRDTPMMYWKLFG